MPQSRYLAACLLFLFSYAVKPASAQLGFELDIKKPEPYENRELRAEKTSSKKFTVPRRFFQNTTTHYNYFFNATNKLNEVLDKAKASHKDDYSKLLSFYNFSLDQTTGDSLQLDSVMYKSKTGIVMHDLRNDWIDDLYLLWGASYYLKQQYDSAYAMFQFINYSFAEKEKDGYYRYIGSRMDGNNATSIATVEDDGFIKRMVSDPPSRNAAFIWQIRTLIQQDALPEAGSLIAALKNDPHFPERLKPTLEEVHAFWFYKQEMWDSSATHLIKALDVAESKAEKGRWEYLAAQMFEKAAKLDGARQYYNKAIVHTTDPVLEIYARLNLIRINKEGGDNYIDQNIAELLKMAKKDKYEEYRDAIYYMAAQMELSRNNFDAAQQYLIKGSKYQSLNNSSANRAFLNIADLSYDQKNYIQAAAFYDSVKLNDLTPVEEQRIMDRKNILSGLTRSINTITRQDSIQRIANLPQEERDEYIKKLVKQLRKQQGLKDEEATVTKGSGSQNNTATDLFGKQDKGEWYFNNPTLKTQGSAAFKQIWGNRPNIDNWRRFADVSTQLRNNAINNTRGNVNNSATDVSTSPTFDALTATLPLTPEKLQASNDSLQNALFNAGNTFLNDLEDYGNAIKNYERLRNNFPQFTKMSEVLFNLYYSYLKNGNTSEAASIKKLIETNYPNSRYAKIITTGKDPVNNKAPEEITKVYEGIYDLYVEGRFTEAEAQKRAADSIYKTNYWSPQLLYIQAVYHVKQREDSIAKGILTTLIRQNAKSPIVAKADNLLKVLSRRAQIEDELTKLQIERPVEDTVAAVVQNDIIIPTGKKDTTIAKPIDVAANTQKAITPIQPKADSVVKTQVIPKPANNSIFSFNTDVPHFAVVVLNKVDIVFTNEAKNAFFRYNRQKFANKPLELTTHELNADTKLLLIGNFVNLLDVLEYGQKIKQEAASEIVPWLKADKYSFTVISAQNLEVLKANPDLVKYKEFIDKNLPVKF